MEEGRKPREGAVEKFIGSEKHSGKSEAEVLAFWAGVFLAAESVSVRDLAREMGPLGAILSVTGIFSEKTAKNKAEIIHSVMSCVHSKSLADAISAYMDKERLGLFAEGFLRVGEEATKNSDEAQKKEPEPEPKPEELH